MANEDGAAVEAGALDQPTGSTATDKVTLSNQSSSRLDLSIASDTDSDAPEDVNALRQAVEADFELLGSLSDSAVKLRADRGERAAMVALGERFAMEAASLAFAPAAANAALSDAVKYYSLAASHGFPGAPSLDQAGVRFYPVRMHRGPRKR